MLRTPILSDKNEFSRKIDDITKIDKKNYSISKITETSLQGGPKNWHIFVCLITDFQNYFTIKIKRKCALILSLKISPNFKCVATLPCKISIKCLKATIFVRLNYQILIDYQNFTHLFFCLCCA